MKMFCNRFVLHLKSIKAMFFIPIVAVFVILPLMAYMAYKSENLDFYLSTMGYIYILLPISSIIWSIFIMKEYVEGKGNELLYVTKNKIKFFDYFVPFIIFYLLSFAVFFAFSFVEKNFIYEYARFFFICLFYFSIAYFLSYFSKSTLISLMFLMAYTILDYLLGTSIDEANAVTEIFIYYRLSPYNTELFLSRSVPLLATAVIFIVFGVVLNKKISRFN